MNSARMIIRLSDAIRIHEDVVQSVQHNYFVYQVAVHGVSIATTHNESDEVIVRVPGFLSVSTYGDGTRACVWLRGDAQALVTVARMLGIAD